MSTSLHHFLPAVLEVQESPPNPLARRLLLAIVAFAVFAVAWACIGKVDVVSIAEGKLVPSSRVKQIQPLQRGVVTQILVREDQRVQAGDTLVVLDRTSTAAERARLAGELQAVEEALARDRNLVELLGTSCVGAPFMAPADKALQGAMNQGVMNQGVMNHAPTGLQQDLLRQQFNQFCAQQGALQSQRDNRAAEREVNREMIRKLEATLPVITQRAANTKALTEKKLAMENDYLALEEQRLSQEHELAAAKARDVQLAAAVKEAERQLAALQAQVQAQTLTAIAEGERQQKSLQELLAKAVDVDGRQVITAPVAGTVKDLAIHTLGGVVLEAQQLMLVVPEDELLEVEAWLPNKDIGFVREGAQAVVKVHTFPFSKYGTIPATVVRVADDAVSPEKMKNAVANDPQAGAVYGMSLALERNTLDVDGKTVRLAPGMQVTAEVITHQRRLIEYFLSPLKKHLQESVRER